MHISSLPSNYGIGTVGDEAFKFVDFLAQAGQSLWQILPVCPTGYGNSPYQSYSTFAGNVNFIDLDYLIRDGLLQQSDCTALDWGTDPLRVDYDALYKNRLPVLKKAAIAFLQKAPTEFFRFCTEQAFWLDDYALFMTIKADQNEKPWYEWDTPLKLRDPSALSSFSAQCDNIIIFHKALQYLFYEQWGKLKSYANEHSVQIIGDLPIYVAMDSADVWANTSLFLLNDDCTPIEVAGVPPDAFTEDGQLWGNPLYDYSKMAADGYSWWLSRIAFAATLYDVTRIDHFRAFESYYAVAANAPNAKLGTWKKGPGADFFEKIEAKLGKLNIIAEDLGFLTDDVYALLDKTGYPGMKVLQFAFDPYSSSNYLPHKFGKNCVAYTGTHDNDTIIGWLESAPGDVLDFAKDYMRLSLNEGLNWGVMKTALASSADTAVLTMQDLLALGSEARMNYPGTTDGNWCWRCAKGDYSTALAEKLRRLSHIYRRV